MQLTFINEINPKHFGNSIDNGEKGLGCDQVPGFYPTRGKFQDKFPDCFHGSSTGNIHFHGTHTNPNSTGDNVFTPSAPRVGRLFWPFFSDYHPYRPGLYTAFLFNTYEGPGIEDPELTVLKLDYDNDSNPAFLIRTVLDELAQVSGDYYLGKAFLKVRRGYKLAAFFALRRYDQ